MHARRLTSVTLATLAALGLASASAHADTTYTNLADFTTALNGGLSSTFTFNGGGSTSQASRTFTQDGFSFTVTASPTSGVYQSGFVGTNTATDDLLLTFTGGGITALGGNFFPTNAADTFLSSRVTLTLSNGQTFDYTPNARNTFRGIIADAPITSLLFSSPTSGGVNRFASVDNLVIGTARTTAAVPEPSQTAALGLGLMSLAGLTLTARKRKAQAI